MTKGRWGGAGWLLPFLLLFPAVAFLVVLYIYPLVISVVRSFEAGNKTFDLSLQELKPGIYSFQFTQGKNTLTGKLAIIH